MEFLRKYKFEIIVFFLVSLVLFVKLGSASLWEPDEPRYAESAREMLESGDYFAPHYEDSLKFDKPILYYWMIAASYKVFGINNFALRFPSALFTLLTLLTIYLITKAIYDRTTAIYSGLVLATIFNFIKYGRYASPDAVWIFFITGAFACYFYGIYNPDKNKIAMPFGYVLLALSTITKSPISLLFFIIVFAIYILIRRDWKIFPLMKLKIGIPIFLSVSLPWFIYMLVQYKGQFIDSYFITNHFVRFFTYELGRARPFYYYGQILIGDFLPWTLFLVLAFFNNRLRWKNIVNRSNNNFMFLILLWGAVIFITFSLSVTKLPHYINPIYPPFSVITGIYIASFIKGERKKGKRCKISQLVIILTIVAVSVLLSIHIIYLIEESLAAFYVYTIPLITLFLAVALIYLFVKKRLAAFIKLTAIGILISFLAVTVLLMPVYEKTKPVINITEYLKEIIQPTDKIALYKTINPAFTYYFNRKISYIDTLNDLQRFLLQKNRVFVITKDVTIYDFENNINARFYRIKKMIRYLPRLSNFYKNPAKASNYELVLLSNRKVGNENGESD